MKYFYAVGYKVNNEGQETERKTICISYFKPCNNTMIKTFISKTIPLVKKDYSLVIEEIESISEEESVR